MDKKKLLAAFKKLEEKLDDKDFDLDAWKSAAAPLLSRTFGKEDARLSQLEALKIDYSSWALRDAPATYQPLASCKKRAREIIQSAVDEVEIFGFGGKPVAMQVLTQVLSEEEAKQLRALADDGAKKGELKKLLEKSGKAKLAEIVAMLLTDPG